MNEGTRTTKEQMLQRVRKALGRRGALDVAPTPPVIDEAIARVTKPEENLTELFAQRASEVGMIVRRCEAGSLATALGAVLTEINARAVTLSATDPAVANLLEERGIRLLDWRGDRTMASHYQADAGISDVHSAIAETGSIVCESDAHHGRGHSLAPAVHIAIVRAEQIVADLLDDLPRHAGKAPNERPSAIAIITGPSKTADIEGILITGVHGPERVYVILVG
ncbi:MAG: hypothetical protein GC162_13570 [Planctomycetes bacterium]|nr:hypothetical protein [Planctomycetota bacterium]